MRHAGTQTIETERLLLRPLTPEDAPMMYANWANDPDVTRWLRWEPHKNVDETRELLAAWALLYPNGDYYQRMSFIKCLLFPQFPLANIKKFRYNFVMKARCIFMPKIRSSADLRNNYNDISTFCHTYAEPVFITKNGKGDLAVMSIETYEELAGRFELYSKLQEGLDDVAAGRERPLDEVMADLRNRRNRR